VAANTFTPPAAKLIEVPDRYMPIFVAPVKKIDGAETEPSLAENVPEALVALMVTAPVAPEMVTFVPATMLVTPVLLTTTAPVVGLTEIPEPEPVTLDTAPPPDGA
jgi:hypothetical protein